MTPTSAGTIVAQVGSTTTTTLLLPQVAGTNLASDCKKTTFCGPEVD